MVAGGGSDESGNSSDSSDSSDSDWDDCHWRPPSGDEVTTEEDEATSEEDDATLPATRPEARLNTEAAPKSARTTRNKKHKRVAEEAENNEQTPTTTEEFEKWVCEGLVFFSLDKGSVTPELLDDVRKEVSSLLRDGGMSAQSIYYKLAFSAVYQGPFSATGEAQNGERQPLSPPCSLHPTSRPGVGWS